MEINRDIECFGTLENRPEKLIVEITAVDMAINKNSLETVVMDGSLQFGGSADGVDCRQGGKSAETSRMAPHGVRQVIVGFTRDRRCFHSFELLCAGGGKRQYLHVDVSGIHFRDPLIAKVAELLKKFTGLTAKFQSLLFEPAPWAIEESRTRKMLFKGYGPHVFRC